MLDINKLMCQIKHWQNSKTIYSIHSPYIFNYLQFVFDKNRVYYPFIALERANSKKTEKVFTPTTDKRLNQRPDISKFSKQVIFRHLIKTNAHNFLSIGCQTTQILNYVQYSGIKNAIAVEPMHNENHPHPFDRDNKSTSISIFKSFADLETKYKSTRIDTICIGSPFSLSEAEADKILQLSSDDGSCIILRPYEMEPSIRSKIESKYPLIISTYSMQIMMRSYTGQAQKVLFTTQSWSKPWVLIHAL